jgi:ferredoxin
MGIKPQSDSEGMEEKKKLSPYLRNPRISLPYTVPDFSLQLCDSCGACSCVCPMRTIYPEFDRKSAPRTLVRRTRMKAKERRTLNNALWLCFTCDACTEVCPQGVRFREFVESEREGILASGRKGKLAVCVSCGRAHIPEPALKALKSRIVAPEYRRLLDLCPTCRRRLSAQPMVRLRALVHQ